MGPGDGNLAAFMIHEVGGGAFHPYFHAAESAHEKIGVEIFAPKFAIGDGLQANFLLSRDDFSDR